jgi:hypothetical protein
LKEGIFHNIPFSEYLGLSAVSNSYLTKFKQCPAKVLVPDEDTPAMLLGRAFHAYILEPDIFEKAYAIAPVCDRRTKAGKETYNKFEISNPMKTILNAEDYQTIQDMKEACLKQPTAKYLLEQGGFSESSVIWKDEETGLFCKCRPDRIPATTNETLIDIKTARSVEAPVFLKEVVYRGYARGAALYQEGISLATGGVFNVYTFIAIEKEPPYRTEVYTLTPELLEYGFDEFHMLLRQVKKCKESGEFPNYKHAGATDLDRPNYAVIDTIG